MPSFVRRAAVPVPVSRSLAFAALLAAPLMVSPLALTGAHAQTSTTTPPSATSSAPGTGKMTSAPGTSTSSRGESVDQRISSLHRELKITPAQESDWNAVASAMRDNANNMQQLVQQTHGQNTQQTTALDDLDTYQKFAQAHADGVKNLIGPFTTLYNAMTPTQQKNADQVFNNFRAQAAERHGARSSG